MDGITVLGYEHANLLATSAYLANEEYYHYYGEDLPEIDPDLDYLKEGIEEWWVYIKQGEIVSFLKTQIMRYDFVGYVCPVALTAYTFLGYRNQNYSKKVLKSFLKGKNQIIFCGYNGREEWIDKIFDMVCKWDWSPVKKQGNNFLMEKSKTVPNSHL